MVPANSPRDRGGRRCTRSGFSRDPAIARGPLADQGGRICRYLPGRCPSNYGPGAENFVSPQNSECRTRRRRVLKAALGLAIAVPAGKIPGAPNRWLDLRPRISIRRETLKSFWETIPFEARFERKPGVNSVLDGVLLQTGPGESGVKAFCTVCPHEICTVRLERDAGGHNPLFVCPCHQSTFDPLADGAVTSGPAHRGLYRFSLSTSAKTIDVVGVEASVVALFNQEVT